MARDYATERGYMLKGRGKGDLGKGAKGKEKAKAKTEIATTAGRKVTCPETVGLPRELRVKGKAIMEKVMEAERELARSDGRHRRRRRRSYRCG